MTHVKTVTSDLKAIPRERLATKLKRTVLGVGFAGLGGFMVIRQIGGTPSLTLVFVGIALCVLGATVWSTELMAAPIKIVVASVRDALNAVRGKGA